MQNKFRFYAKRFANLYINNETGEETDQNNKPQMLVLFEPKTPYGSLKSSYVSLHEMKEKGMLQ
ncbi:phage N-6-adenine-methyltransferase [Haemophilus influenzae]|nr:phage N-6-adenine-methyltransferase [Haemophilus influenzae]